MRYLKLIYIPIIAILAGCATSSLPAVKTDYDKEADFSQYASFNWSDEIDNQKEGHPILNNSLVRKRIKNSIKSEMEGRGYTLKDNADLLINFHLVFEEKTGYTSYPSYGYSYWRRDEVRPYNYKEGTLIIDLVDRKQNQLVWQGYTEGLGNEKPDKMEEKIKRAISLIFQEYKHRSGE